MRRVVTALITFIFTVPVDAANVRPADGLRLRSSPEVRQGNVIVLLDKTNTLVVLQQEGTWLHVRDRSSGRTGWVHRDYVTTLATAKAPARVRRKARASRSRESAKHADVPAAPSSSTQPEPTIMAASIDDRTVVGRIGQCKIRRTLDNLSSYDRHMLQVWLPRPGAGEEAVSARYSISAEGVLRREHPEAEEFARFLAFVKDQARAIGSCGLAPQHDPYEPVPTARVVEAPDVIARVGPCKIRQSMRRGGFDEHLLQGWKPLPSGSEQAVSNLYGISAEGVLRREQPTAGELWRFLQFVQQEAKASGLC